MLLEAVDCHIRYCLADGHEIRLAPGQPVDLPDSQGRTLLARAAGKVRLIREPARGPEGTCGLACHGCGRSIPTLYRLALGWRCESCLAPGSWIWWEIGGTRRGPGVISSTVQDEQGLWCCIEGPDLMRLVLAKVITRLEPGVGKV